MDMINDDWQHVPRPEPAFHPHEIPAGSTLRQPPGDKALDFFSLIFTPDIWETITRYCNYIRIFILGMGGESIAIIAY